MADKSIMEEMLPMKISNWESIEYSEGICCPNPECDLTVHLELREKRVRERVDKINIALGL